MSDEVNGLLRRRDFLKRAGLLGGVLIPVGYGTARAGWLNQSKTAAMPGGMGGGMMGGVAPSPLVIPFQTAFRTPAVLAPARADAHADYYEIAMRPATVEILPGRRTTIWGYNGQFPGPTIKARSGRGVVVRQRNELPDARPSIHLHGGHVEAASDGYPTDVIAPGAFKDYVYPNRQIAATLSYHDHQMEQTGRNVYMGLFGAYLIEDDVEARLNLPSGAYDVPVIIQDRAFDADGALSYSADMMMGTVGDVILVNGVPYPRFEVANRRYRLRILNGSNARDYELALSSGQSFTQIATDGGLLPRPVSRPTIPVFPFERVEVVVDFSQVPVGSQVILQNNLEVGQAGQIMLFDVARREEDTSSVPPELRPLERLAEGTASATRDFTLGMNMMNWVINGQRFDPGRVDFSPPLGTEIWRFQNRSDMPHPIHVHLNMFQILDRNGAPPPAGEAGWKDTVVVAPNETVRVIVRFTDYQGRYMVHCHNLEHEDNGMMAQFDVAPGALSPVDRSRRP